MRLLLLAAFIVSASAQGYLSDLQNWFNQNTADYTIDYVHNYRFEDHEGQNGYHLLVVISDQDPRECHIIEVSAAWEDMLGNTDVTHMITDELYQLITTHTVQETDLTREELRQTYGDTDALRECFNHSVYILTYVPSQAIVDAYNSAPTTTT